jgi:hypothetical protein
MMTFLLKLIKRVFFIMTILISDPDNGVQDWCPKRGEKDIRTPISPPNGDNHPSGEDNWAGETTNTSEWKSQQAGMLLVVGRFSTFGHDPAVTPAPSSRPQVYPLTDCLMQGKT